MVLKAPLLTIRPNLVFFSIYDRDHVAAGLENHLLLRRLPSLLCGIMQRSTFSRYYSISLATGGYWLAPRSFYAAADGQQNFDKKRTAGPFPGGFIYATVPGQGSYWSLLVSSRAFGGIDVDCMDDDHCTGDARHGMAR